MRRADWRTGVLSFGFLVSKLGLRSHNVRRLSAPRRLPSVKRCGATVLAPASRSPEAGKSRGWWGAVPNPFTVQSHCVQIRGLCRLKIGASGLRGHDERADLLRQRLDLHAAVPPDKPGLCLRHPVAKR